MRSRSRGRMTTWLLLAPMSLWFALLLIAPLIVVVVFSVGERSHAGGYQPAFTFDQYANLATRATAFANTLQVTFLGTVICMLVAYPLAYYLAIFAGRRKTILLILVVVPFWTSMLIRSYAWMTILGSNGVPAFLQSMGIAEDLVLLNTPFAVTLGLVYNYLSLMVLPIYVALERMDKRLIEAAKDLGSGSVQAFLQVTAPLTAPGVVTGGMLVFIFMAGDYVIPALLGGNRVFLVSNALVDLFLQSQNWPFGAALAVALTVIMLGLVGIYLKLTRRLNAEPADVSLL